MKFTSKAAALVALGFGAVAADAATLIVDGNGILTGATGVTVGSDVYDVTFTDGTCAQVYGTCATGSFTFTKLVDVRAAAQALLDQVFIDQSPFGHTAGNFDSHPELTNGCTDTFECRVFIPYKVTGAAIQSSQAVNYSASQADVIGSVGAGVIEDFSTENDFVWATFTKEAAAVPEPASWALFIGGFGLIGGAARRRRAAVHFA